MNMCCIVKVWDVVIRSLCKLESCVMENVTGKPRSYLRLCARKGSVYFDQSIVK